MEFSIFYHIFDNFGGKSQFLNEMINYNIFFNFYTNNSRK